MKRGSEGGGREREGEVEGGRGKEEGRRKEGDMKRGREFEGKEREEMEGDPTNSILRIIAQKNTLYTLRQFFLVSNILFHTIDMTSG